MEKRNYYAIYIAVENVKPMFGRIRDKHGVL